VANGHAAHVVTHRLEKWRTWLFFVASGLQLLINGFSSAGV
jgi:hypothetical protein